MAVLSLVIPFLNESASVAALADYIRQLEEGIKRDFDLDLQTVLVDDGSTDDTIGQLRTELTGTWKIVELSRNFGKEIALFAGIEATDGDYVMMVDADLQHPLAVCFQLVSELLSAPELDMVYTVRQDREDGGAFAEVGASLFYRMINYRQRFQLPPDAGDFRIMRRMVADALLKVRDKRRFNKGLYSWTGFRQKGIPYVPDARVESVSRWSKLSLVALSLEGITSFSVIPLRMFSAIGALVGLSGALYGLKILFEVMFWGVSVPGYPSLMVAVSMLGGLNLALLGLIGEYLWVSVSEAKDRPLYLVRKVHSSVEKV